MAIEQLAHCAYPALPEDHIRREAGKAFADGVEDPDVKIQLLLGGGKTVNEVLRQALELQSVLLAARLHKMSTRTFWGSRSPPPWRRDTRRSACWSCGEPGHFRGSCPYGRETENDQRLKRDERSSRDTREPPRKSEWLQSNNREADRSDGQPLGNERASAYTLRAPHHMLAVSMEQADPSLVTQGWVDDKPYRVLFRVQDGQEQVIAYYSKMLNKAKRNYCITRRELLPIMRTLEHFRKYLYGQEFNLRTDYSALTWLMSFKNLEGQTSHWIQCLEKYNFTSEHCQGRKHNNTDALSRTPCLKECT
jgi:hypothetical protein